MHCGRFPTTGAGGTKYNAVGQKTAKIAKNKRKKYLIKPARASAQSTGFFVLLLYCFFSSFFALFATFCSKCCCASSGR
jgi:hypothetical protein